jgi:hypothetical protein
MDYGLNVLSCFWWQVILILYLKVRMNWLKLLSRRHFSLPISTDTPHCLKLPWNFTWSGVEKGTGPCELESTRELFQILLLWCCNFCPVHPQMTKSTGAQSSLWYKMLYKIVFVYKLCTSSHILSVTIQKAMEMLSNLLFYYYLGNNKKKSLCVVQLGFLILWRMCTKVSHCSVLICAYNIFWSYSSLYS